MSIELIIESNTNELIQAWKNNEITLQEIKDSLTKAESEEEYEVAITFRYALKLIENNEI